MGLAVLCLAERPDRTLKIDIAPERSDHLPRAAAGEQHKGQRIAHGTAVGAARQPPDECRELGIGKSALPAHLGCAFDTQRRKHKVIGNAPLFCSVGIGATYARKQISAAVRRAFQRGSDDFILQFASCQSGGSAIPDFWKQVASQQPRALRAPLLFAQFLCDEIINQVLDRIAR